MADQIFLLDGAKTALRPLASTKLHALGMKEGDVEALLARLSGPLFGRDLLWIGRQAWASDDQRSDLLGLDSEGALIIAELKRGDASPESLTQALGYAAQFAVLNLDELAQLWLDTGKKVSGLVAAAPAGLDDAREKLRGRPEDPGTLNAEQVVLLIAESFDPRLLATCSYLSEALETAALSVECWEYAVHQLPDAPAGYVVTLRQVVPSRTVRDEIEARQDLRGEKDYKRRIRFKNDLVVHLNAALASSGWQFNRGGTWYSLAIRKQGWPVGAEPSIEFREREQPILYLPPTLKIDSELQDGVAQVEDWKDEKGVTWRRYVFPFGSTSTSFTASLGEIVRRTLGSISPAG